MARWWTWKASKLWEPLFLKAPYTDLSQAYISPNRDFMLIGKDIHVLASGVRPGQLGIAPNYQFGALLEDGLTLVFLTNIGLEFWQSL